MTATFPGRTQQGSTFSQRSPLLARRRVGLRRRRPGIRVEIPRRRRGPLRSRLAHALQHRRLQLPDRADRRRHPSLAGGRAGDDRDRRQASRAAPAPRRRLVPRRADRRRGAGHRFFQGPRPRPRRRRRAARRPRRARHQHRRPQPAAAGPPASCSVRTRPRPTAPRRAVSSATTQPARTRSSTA